ncbi:DUF3800 domain-containing protein [Deinococcus arenicola]|uniref:DUF3800 domain-containing protein n=1 Tax=Deinococcus arenicola TaxID=2994950 RepID=A0ABU4DVK4_9DEIO|nr:DUF3800 domain-containing protein [Deinococcus sp. ZS9-10]MDV6376451.1 DUF3800 domain-containing protein [Deinococcus sp. ZS9-10]
MPYGPIEADRLVAIDEFEKDDLFVLGHLVFSKKQAEMAVKKWRKLQTEIKEALLRREAYVHPKLEGDQLPEIHAEWLVQSGKYYRWQKSADQTYWRQHFIWLEEAMRIIRHCSPTTHYGFKYNHREREKARLKKSEIYENTDFIADFGNSAHDNLVSVLLNPYPISFCSSLVGLQKMFQERNQTFEIICDNRDECKGFSSLTVYEELQRHKLIASAVAPQFLSSEEEPLIQMADVVSYAAGQYIWLLRKREENPNFVPNEKVTRVIQGFKRYLAPLDGEGRPWRPHRGAEVDALSTPIFLEIVARAIGGSNQLADALLESRDQRIQNLIRSQNESEPIRRLAPPTRNLP